MQTGSLIKFWVENEIKEQTDKISKLEKSGLNKLSGFKDLLEMRKQFLTIAKNKLESLKQKS